MHIFLFTKQLHVFDTYKSNKCKTHKTVKYYLTYTLFVFNASKKPDHFLCAFLSRELVMVSRLKYRFYISDSFFYRTNSALTLTQMSIENRLYLHSTCVKLSKNLIIIICFYDFYQDTKLYITLFYRIKIISKVTSNTAKTKCAK